MNVAKLISSSRLLHLASFLSAVFVSLSTMAVYGQAYTLTIDAAGNTQAASSTLRMGQDNPVTQNTLTVAVTCPNAATCTGLQMGFFRNATPISFKSATLASGTTATFTVVKSTIPNGTTSLGLGRTNAAINAERFPLAINAPPSTHGSTSSGMTDNLITRVCAFEASGQSYNADEDRAEIVITPLGQLISGTLRLFDENDDLYVTIVGDPRLIPSLKVERASAFGTRGVVRIVGEDAQIPDALLERQSRDTEETPPSCITRTYILSDFAPGKGEVEVKVSGDPDRTIGRFEFNVNPLYTGMFSLGGVLTEAVDPSYKLTRNGATDAMPILIEGHTGDTDFLYVLMYTHYIWNHGKLSLSHKAKRDLEKRYEWYTNINPTIGLALTDPLRSWFAGLSITLGNGFVITAGGHLRNIDTLTNSTDAEVGEPFDPGDADTDLGDVDLPTSQKTDLQFYAGITVDLRAAAKTFGAVFRSVGGN